MKEDDVEIALSENMSDSELTELLDNVSNMYDDYSTDGMDLLIDIYLFFKDFKDSERSKRFIYSHRNLILGKMLYNQSNIYEEIDNDEESYDMSDEKMVDILNRNNAYEEIIDGSMDRIIKEMFEPDDLYVKEKIDSTKEQAFNYLLLKAVVNNGMYSLTMNEKKFMEENKRFYK